MKKLIIVCEEKCRQYGDYLAQLISAEDDTEDKTVGTKDGEVASMVWLEKDYKANAAQLSSNQYLLFIGQDDFIKKQSAYMNVVFSGFGIKYGWLGKQAVLSVEKVVEADEYEKFISYARRYKQNVERLIKSKDKKSMEDYVVAGAVGVVETVGTAKTAKTLLHSSPVALALVPIAGIGVVGMKTVKKYKLNSKIKEQQYSCAVMKFYLDDLSKFLGL